MSNVVALPGVALPERCGLNLTEDEVREAAGGYLRPADQLRELHARGFVRAKVSTVGRKRVILERGHYEAVISGRYGPAPANDAAGPAGPKGADIAALKAWNKRKRS